MDTTIASPIALRFTVASDCGPNVKVPFFVARHGWFREVDHVPDIQMRRRDVFVFTHDKTSIGT
jgi:hypothetical protein